MLAVKYDTTQAEIIKRAIELFEVQENMPENPVPPRVREELNRASAVVFRTNTRRQRIVEALTRPGIDIDDLRMVFDG